MLHSGIVFSLLMLLCIGSAGNTRVVEKPLFWARTIDNVEVRKVVVNDTETIVYMEVASGNDRVNGIDREISLIADGVQYDLREARGVQLPRSIVSPAILEPGNSVFELVFPPLANSVRQFDLMLARKTKAVSCIYGIRLKKDKDVVKRSVPSALRGRKVNPTREWEAPKCQFGRTRLDIYFMGYQPQCEGTGSVSWGGLAPGLEEFVVPEDGHVILEFDQYLSSMMMVEFLGKKIGVVVDPGERATLYADVQEMNLRYSNYFRGDRRPLGYFEGNRMDLNQWLLGRHVTAEKLVWNKDWGIDPEKYVTLCMEQYGKGMQKIDADSSLNEEFRYYSGLEAQLNYLKQVIGIIGYFRSMYDLPLGDERLPRVKAEYFTRLKAVDLTNYDLMLLDNSVLNSVLKYFPTHDEAKANWGEGYLSDLSKAQVCVNRFVYKLPLREEELAVMRTATPKTVRLFEMINTEGHKAWNAHIAKPGYKIREAPEVADSELFDVMMKEYRGKVVVIDFWGTACRPCVKAMKLMKPLKKELKGQPIVYVYITGTSSAPLELWQQMIPDIGGDHYRLERKQYKALNEKFNIQGVPFYLILDKEGKIVREDTGFMGCDKMKELLMNLVKK